MSGVGVRQSPRHASLVFFFRRPSSSVSHSTFFAFLTLTLMNAFSSVTVVPEGTGIGTLPTRDSFGAFPGSRIWVLARMTSDDGRDALELVEAAPAAGMARLRSMADCITRVARWRKLRGEERGSTRRGKARANLKRVVSGGGRRCFIFLG